LVDMITAFAAGGQWLAGGERNDERRMMRDER
jgi:hypothetical protein